MTARKRKLWIIGGIAAFCAVLLVLLLLLTWDPGRKGIGSRLWDRGICMEERATEAGGSLSQRPSIHEEGIFYIEGTRLCYYDYEDGNSYVLCSDPDCRHLGEDCGAYVGDSPVRGGYTMHQGRIYVVVGEYQPYAQSRLQLVSMDRRGEDRKVAAVLDASGREMEGWAVRQFGDVYYDHGYAYMSLMLSREQQGQTTDGVQLVAIRLADGQVTELTDVMEGDETLEFELITETDVVYSVWGSEEDVPPEAYRVGESFLPEKEQAGVWSEDKEEERPAEIRYYDFHPKSGQRELLLIQDLPLSEIFLGYRARLPLLEFFGEVDGRWLMACQATKRMDGEHVYFLWDPGKRQAEVLAETKSSADGFCGGGYESVSNVLFDRNQVLWQKAVPGIRTRHELYLYDLDTGTMEKLYDLDTEKEDYSPDIRGMTDAYVVVGKRNLTGQITYYIVEKEDFVVNCLEKARRTPVYAR